ncbi:GNAT family N-acetyltransferase [Candidatus Poribacteria bacterium]|jgi:GNAT superfamily N-acetyltransferase|nr:GNAT family N-acetyltransferase [Candidatus Poribacteria bacterium]MBT5536234.1 GNAT family N-acetyltransferase [Candidatus Poribacteria bacterium]MBT5712850.1 GNAT family N-acetyltransferase [Candidatus Poribacteria bacterium]MBT7101022.1 GNAT family N-acetyltransferase [Candidatus Poribacteria bacterium]MBT7806742.1 GNAT family N-acetyltransferase [Candidatus Poribacteria bacterium]
MPTLSTHTDADGVARIELELAGEAVSSLLVIPMQVRIGDVPIQAGGLAWVETRPEHRGRGFARRIIEQSTRHMIRQGYDLAGLFGIGDFYERWAYACALPEYSLRVAASACPSLAEYRSVLYRRDHRPAICRMHSGVARHRTLSRVRDPAAWPYAGRDEGIDNDTGFHEDAAVRVLVDTDGKPCGYAALRFEEGVCVVDEVGYASMAAIAPLTSLVAGEAHAAGVAHCEYSVAPDDALSRFLVAPGRAVRVRWPRTGGGMFRILRLLPLFETLTPLLGRRLRASPLAEWVGSLAFVTDIGVASLRVSRGAVRASDEIPPGDVLRVEMSQARLTQMMAGYLGPQALAASGDANIPPDAAPLLAVLFPGGYAHMWPGDRF